MLVMKRPINADYFRVDGQNLPINCVKGSGCYPEILTAIYTQLRAMLSHHNKILVIRVDIHFPDNPKTNKTISLILKKFKRQLEKKGYALKRLGYVWAREMSSTQNIHYHLVYMVDGNKAQSSFTLNQLLDEVVMFIDTKINIHFPTKGKSSYRMIKRSDKQGILNIFKWLSYLAKERSKGQREATINDYSASRLCVRDYPKENRH